MSTYTTPARRQTYSGARTPRPSIGINTGSYNKPAPSAMAPAVPFDWEAARGRKPPPYSTPENRRLRKLISSAVGTPSDTPSGTPWKGTPSGRRSGGPHVRRVSLFQRSCFKLSLFPHNLPLPHPRTAARTLAGIVHVLHMVVRYTQTRTLRDDELGWEDMLSEADAALPGFSWLTILNLFFVLVSLANAAYLASRSREYTHFRAQEPLNTPHARFVPAKEIFDDSANSGPSLIGRLGGVAWKLTKATWRWVAGVESPPAIEEVADGRVIQKVDMWMPEEFEKTFFTIYSPVHAILWMFWTPSHWLGITVAMTLLGIQLSILIKAYDGLVKDMRILQASVLAEYDQTFVQPRLNIIRRDAMVQTYPGEIQNQERHRRRYTDFQT
ncbi:hypothetical protein BKA62DRAFT_684465 [Auriculariales sp. MPI-PUGE-AT-0066]|nr:hypothetical protein BKA62DRAFT_684465 [Auriculariales sp. MPI-PUGE-AT-0066]